MPVYLRDIAQVKDAFEEVRQLIRLDGQPAIRMSVRKQSGANTVTVANAVQEELAAIAREDAPPSKVAELVARTWESVVATDFKVVIEAWLAAANDPALRGALDDEAQAFFWMARGARLGLALGRATNRGRPVGHEPGVLEHLMQIADRHDARIERERTEKTR